MQLFSKIMKYIWPQMRKYKGAFLAILVLFILRMLFGSILAPLYFKKIIDIISAPVPDRSFVSEELLETIMLIVLINLAAIAVARGCRYIYGVFEINVMRELKNFAFQRLASNSQSFFSNTFAGSLVTKSRRFVYAFESMFDIFIYTFLRFFITLVGVFIVLTLQSPVISLIFIAWALVHITGVSFFVRRKMKYDILEAEQDSRISGRLADVYSNISAVKFFSALKREISSFGGYTEEGAVRSRRSWFFGANIDLGQGIFVFVIQSLILYVMIRLWIQGRISSGTVVLIQTYMIIIVDQLWEFGNQLTRFMKSASDMKELVDLFEIEPDILDPQSPEEFKMKKGHILFENVSFKYDSGEEVLSNFNLEVKPGERLGIVGHSGAGKSTITRLLLRLNDVSGGMITIDGQDIRNLTQDDLRSVISYVPQEPALFHRSIQENISYGNPDADFAQIVESAKKAHAHEFILRLPKAYLTLVGERGVKLSGGERQRVAIARAMLKNSPILVLDEATSSLDSVSERYIQDAFGELMKGRTTIVIAHRLSTIQKLDRIIVLDKGKIVEDGTHKELLGKGGLYAELWNHQTGGFLEA